jgi:spectrin alpha
MRLKQLALMRQEKLFGAHEIQRFNRDADETVAWISEKDVVLSSDDYGRDLASVQTLQVEIWLIYLFCNMLHKISA